MCIEGYVSPERAERDYGVVVTKNGRDWHIDETATAKLRGAEHLQHGGVEIMSSETHRRRRARRDGLPDGAPHGEQGLRRRGL